MMKLFLWMAVGLAAFVKTDQGGLDVALVSETAELVCLSDFRGKTIAVDFWYTGCGGCKRFHKDTFDPLAERLESDSTVVMISISADRSYAKWGESLATGEYTSKYALNLYTGGKGFRHPLLQRQGINRYPSLLLISPSLEVVKLTGLNRFSSEELYNRIKALK